MPADELGFAWTDDAPLDLPGLLLILVWVRTLLTKDREPHSLLRSYDCPWLLAKRHQKRSAASEWQESSFSQAWRPSMNEQGQAKDSRNDPPLRSSEHPLSVAPAECGTGGRLLRVYVLATGLRSRWRHSVGGDMALLMELRVPPFSKFGNFRYMGRTKDWPCSRCFVSIV